MKNKRLLKLLGAIALAVLIAIPLMVGCAAPAPAPATPAPAPAEELPEIEIKFSTWASSESMIYKLITTEAARLIEEAVPRAKVTIYPAGSLIALSDNYRGAEEGVVDFTSVFCMVIPGVIPLMDIVLLPGLFPNTATSTVVLRELHKKYPCFEEQFSPKLKYMMSTPAPRCEIHSSTPIRSLDEMKGKVIASDSAWGLRALELLGASTVHMTGFEAYTAAERGVVDGSLNCWATLSATKLYEVFDYHTLLSICPVVPSWVFCRDTWNKFTPEEQDRLEAWFNNFYYIYNIGVVSTAKDGLTICREDPHEIISWSKEDMDKVKGLLEPVWNEWAEEMEELGYPGKDIIEDAIRLIDVYSNI